MCKDDLATDKVNRVKVFGERVSLFIKDKGTVEIGLYLDPYVITITKDGAMKYSELKNGFASKYKSVFSNNDVICFIFDNLKELGAKVKARYEN